MNALGDGPVSTTPTIVHWRRAPAIMIVRLLPRATSESSLAMRVFTTIASSSPGRSQRPCVSRGAKKRVSAGGAEIANVLPIVPSGRDTA